MDSFSAGLQPKARSNRDDNGGRETPEQQGMMRPIFRCGSKNNEHNGVGNDSAHRPRNEIPICQPQKFRARPRRPLSGWVLDESLHRPSFLIDRRPVGFYRKDQQTRAEGGPTGPAARCWLAWLHRRRAEAAPRRGSCEPPSGWAYNVALVACRSEIVSTRNRSMTVAAPQRLAPFGSFRSRDSHGAVADSAKVSSSAHANVVSQT